MEVLLVVGFLFGVIALVYGYIRAVELTNGHSLDTYQFKPVTFVRAACLLPTLILGLVALVAHSTGNVVAASFLAGGSAYIVGWYIAKHSSVRVAFVSLVLLVPMSLFVIALAAAINDFFSGNSRRKA